MNLSSFQILERINDAVVTLDTQWRFTYVNRRAGELCCRSPESLVGRDIWSEFPDVADQPFGHACRRAAQEQVALQIEDYNAALDRWFECRIHPSPDGISVFSTDITERKRAETALQDSEQRFRTLVETSPEPISIAVEGRFAYANHAMLRLLGAASLADLLDRPVLQSVHPDDRSRVEERVRRMLAGESVGADVQRWIRLDGGEVWVEAVSSPTTHQGRPAHQTFARDATERMRAEEELRESEERYRLVTRATSDVIWDYDLVAGQVYWGESLASTFGYDPAEERLEIGWWEERIHPDDAPLVLARLKEAVRGGKGTWSDEYRFRRADGQYAIVYDRGSIHCDAQGQPVRAIGSMQDVTEKRAAEAELRALFSAMQDVILVLDRDGTYRKIAPTNPDLLFRPSEELIGRTYHDLLPREQADFFLRSIRTALEEDRPVSIEYALEISGRELWFAATLSPMTHDSVVWIARDVTERRRAEEALRASERRYREIFEQSRDTIYVRHVDGTLIDANPAAEEVFGAPREELLKHNVREFYGNPADRERLQHEVSIYGSIRNCEVRLRRLDGTEFDALVSTTALRSESGHIIGYQGTVHDITARKDAERRLRAQEARFRSLIENVHDIITVLEPDGTISYISPSVERALGRPAEEFLGTNASRWIHPDDYPAMAAAVAEDLLRPGAGRTMHVRAQRRDGTWRRLEMFSRNLVQDADVAGVILTARDVTERSEAEEALQRSEAWFRSLTQNALDITTVLDASGRIRYATPSGARTLGYGKGDLRNRTLLDLIHPEDQAQVAAALTQLVEGGSEPISITTRIQAHDESWRVHQSVAQSLLHDPSVRGIVINSRDVTEQRRLEAQLRQAQKMEAVGRLAGGVAHDFNNVLMAITGFAALLEAELPRDGEAAQYLTEIHKSADRAASLTRQLLAFGRKQALRPKVVNLNSVVHGAGAMLRRLVREDIELIYRHDSLLGQCRVDPHQVEQVLVNLVVNACDALPEGGVIEIATRNRLLTERDRRIHAYMQPGSYTALSVRDTGHGMDPDTVAKIFEPFFTTKELGKGTGLGLSTVYGIVKQSGGYIAVESRPGAGSTFTVLFPRIEAEESARGLRTRSPLREGNGTILLAEDEDAVRLLARLTLQKAGYTVLEARDGEEALRIAREHQGVIDLLLTDVVMPHLGGYALSQRLREQRPSLRVVFMSGYPGTAVREIVPHVSELDFIAKPITPEVLTHRIEEALASMSSVSRSAG